MAALFELSTEALDPDALRQRIEDLGCGAVVLFEGRCAIATAKDRSSALSAEAYAAGGAGRGQAVVAEMRSAHALSEVLVVHRTGEVGLGELRGLWGQCTASRCRFAGCAATISAIKARVPGTASITATADREWLHPPP